VFLKTVQSVDKASKEVWEEFISQTEELSILTMLKTCESLHTCKKKKKKKKSRNVSTLPKVQCVLHNCAKFKECRS
jgi:hypothetical protein